MGYFQEEIRVKVSERVYISEILKIQKRHLLRKIEKEKSISRLTFNNSVFYSTVTDSILFISNRLKLVEASSDNTTIDSEAQKLLNISNSDHSASVLFNLKNKTKISHDCPKFI